MICTAGDVVTQQAQATTAGAPESRRPGLQNAVRTRLSNCVRNIDGFFFARDETPWELVRIGGALLVLGPSLLSGLSGNYERLYGHSESLSANRVNHYSIGEDLSSVELCRRNLAHLLRDLRRQS